MLRKANFIFLILIILLTNSVCMAKISADEMRLGGIHLGMDKVHVKNIMGEPDNIVTHTSSLKNKYVSVDEWIYYDPRAKKDPNYKKFWFKVFFAYDSAYKVRSQNPNFGTIAGINVFDKIDKIKKYYGNPDHGSDNYIAYEDDSEYTGGLMFKLLEMPDNTVVVSGIQMALYALAIPLDNNMKD